MAITATWTRRAGATRLARLALTALLAFGALDCRGADGELNGGGAPAGETSEAVSTVSTASASTAEAPIALVDGGVKASPTPSCESKRAGQMVCDGLRLLRCGEGDVVPAEIRSCLDIETCDAEQGGCAPGCPEGSVYVPATGPDGFVMGRGVERYGFGSRASRNPGHGVADTPHTVVLTKPFCMDAHEVTVTEYAACIERGVCTKPDFKTSFGSYPAGLDRPVNMIDWHQAKRFCESVGKTLPTEAQWEWAATGGDRRLYPWGDDTPDCDHADFTPGELPTPACDCGCSGGGPSPVGSHPRGDKEWPSGKIHDLAGNVWEWCLDNYAPYKPLPAVDPFYTTAEESSHIVRGGGWNRSGAGLTTSFRGSAVVDYQRPGLGARCIKNPT